VSSIQAKSNFFLQIRRSTEEVVQPFDNARKGGSFSGRKTDNIEIMMSVWFFARWQMLLFTRSSVPARHDVAQKNSFSLKNGHVCVH
jgi:hypothetical protein